MSITRKHRDLLRHALGLSRGNTEYRNHFVASNGSPDCLQWNELVSLGLAKSKEFGGAPRSTIFFVTDEGRAAARAALSKAGA